MNQAKPTALALLAALSLAPWSARAEEDAMNHRAEPERSAVSARSPLAEMRAAALLAADLEPERLPLPALPPSARRELLRQIVRQEIAREDLPGAPRSTPPPAGRRADAARGERSDGKATADEAVKAQGAARGRKVANENGKATGNGNMKQGRSTKGLDEVTAGRAALRGSSGGGLR